MQGILVLNPGSTSTKVAYYNNEQCVFSQSIEHPTEELSQHPRVADQLEMRFSAIEQLLQSKLGTIRPQCIMARGGMLRPIPGGIYAISEQMITELSNAQHGEHASNLGALLAQKFAHALGVKAYVADPPIVDEMNSIAKLTGIPAIKRRSILHALNQKAVARRAAQILGKEYAATRLIVAHIGGGISVCSHSNGRIIDTNNAYDGDGPFSPERAGSIPAGQLVELCFSGTYTMPEIKKMLTGQGGLVAHLGTNSGKEIALRIKEGDTIAKECYLGMAYQIVKSIGAQYAVLQGNIDAIILTGGLMHDELLQKYIADHVHTMGKILLFPGEDEMLALAEVGVRILQGEQAQEY